MHMVMGQGKLRSLYHSYLTKRKKSYALVVNQASYNAFTTANSGKDAKSYGQVCDKNGDIIVCIWI